MFLKICLRARARAISTGGRAHLGHPIGRFGAELTFWAPKWVRYPVGARCCEHFGSDCFNISTSFSNNFTISCNYFTNYHFIYPFSKPIYEKVTNCATICPFWRPLAVSTNRYAAPYGAACCVSAKQSTCHERSGPMSGTCSAGAIGQDHVAANRPLLPACWAPYGAIA